MYPSPQISVIMPVYNCSKYIDEAINSILNQSFKNYEFIIIDDGSIDNTVERIEQYSDERIRLFKREHLGIVAQLNYGLEQSKGEFIARADGDDISLPNRLSKQLEFILQNEGIGIIGSSYTNISEKGKQLFDRWFPSLDADIRDLFPVFCPISHGTVLYNKELVQKTGGYKYDSFPNEDYDLWLRLSERTLMANIEESLVLVRKHGKSATSLHSRIAISQRYTMANNYIDNKLKDKNLSDAVRFNLEIKKARCEYYYGSVSIARKMFWKLILRSPRDKQIWRYYIPSCLGDYLFNVVRRSKQFNRMKNLFRNKKTIGKYFYI
jgi:glycosyltransferase involved in cell wall biosynthesis